MQANLLEVLDRIAKRGLRVDVEGLNKFYQKSLAGRDQIAAGLSAHGITEAGSRKHVDLITGCGMKQDKVTLSKLHNPVLDKVVEHRSYQREASYAQSFLTKLNPSTGRVHWTWEEAESGRLYTKEYNVQQISKSARDFVLPDNGLFVCLDYRQAEVRVAAVLSGDEQLKKDIASGDVYSLLADIYFKGIKDSRDAVKVMVLGIFYGMNEQGISMRLDIPVEAARKIHDSMMNRYSRLAEWIKETHVKASQTGQVTTLDGFTRKLVEPDHDKRMRQAINTTVQGSMADVLKRALVEASTFMSAEVVCAVHDSIILDTTQVAYEINQGGWKCALEFSIEGVKMELKAKTGLTWGSVTDDKPALVETRI